MVEILHMGWPFATVCIAFLGSVCIIYSIRATAWAEAVRRNPTIKVEE